MSVPSPIFLPLPACDPVVVFDELLLLPLPPQPATKRASRPRNTSGLFIPTLSDKVCDYGAKTVSELSSAHPPPDPVSLAVALQVRASRLHLLLWELAQ